MVQKKTEEYTNPDNCPVRNVLDRIGDKWSMLILLLLNEADVLRFNELHKGIDTISQKMLSTTLKTLEADDLVARQVYPEIPPRVEYRLTERGKSLIPHLQNLVDWAMENFDAIRDSRHAYAS